MYIVEAVWSDGPVDFWMCDSRDEAVSVVDRELDYYNGRVSYRKATAEEITQYLFDYVNGESTHLNLGRYIFLHRKHRGITQTELAVAVGSSQPTISDWEYNRARPSGDLLSNLEEFFGFKWPE